MGSRAGYNLVGTGEEEVDPSTQGWGKSGTLPVFLSCPAPPPQPHPESGCPFWVEKLWRGSRVALFTREIMQATDVILNFLVAILKSKTSS